MIHLTKLTNAPPSHRRCTRTAKKRPKTMNKKTISPAARQLNETSPREVSRSASRSCTCARTHTSQWRRLCVGPRREANGGGRHTLGSPSKRSMAQSPTKTASSCRSTSEPTRNRGMDGLTAPAFSLGATAAPRARRKAVMKRSGRLSQQP